MALARVLVPAPGGCLAICSSTMSQPKPGRSDNSIQPSSMTIGSVTMSLRQDATRYWKLREGGYATPGMSVCQGDKLSR